MDFAYPVGVSWELTYDANHKGQQMDAHQLKFDIARAQLGAATGLFLRDRDPISVHALACGACELLEGVGQVENVEVLSALVLKLNPDMKPGKIVRLRNQYWNAIKHFYAQDKKTVREDAALLAHFSDVQNDTVIWQGWHDYQALAGKLPIEAQVLQVWYFAINEDKLAPEVDKDPYRKFFPNIQSDQRTEQKRRLKRACEKFRKNRQIMADHKTENIPLLYRRPE
ncbi:hypothetical protein FMN50_02010 [Rhodobacterales bacterium]|nr:hypothetical protein FMN50_02010 [Rhodobacterales bacterium]